MREILNFGGVRGSVRQTGEEVQVDRRRIGRGPQTRYGTSASERGHDP